MHVIVGRLRIDTFQFGQLTLENLFYFRFPAFLFSLLAKFVNLVILSVAQLILNVLDLLLEEVLTLLAVEFLTRTHLDALFQGGQLDVFVQQLDKAVQPVFQVVRLKQFVLLVDREGEIAGNKVDQHLVVVQVLQGERSVGRNFIGQFNYLGTQLLASVNQCLELIGFLVLHVLLNHRNLTLQEGTGGSDFFQLYLRTRSLKDGRNGSSRHFEHPEHLTDYRNGEQILLLGRVYLTHLLRGNDDRLFALKCLVD